MDNQFHDSASFDQSTSLQHQSILSPNSNQSIITPKTTKHKFYITTIIFIIIISSIFVIIALVNINILSQENSDLKNRLTTTSAALDQATASYLKLPDWNVKFRYPATITNVEYIIDDTQPNTIYFTSITKDETIYTAATCFCQSSSSPQLAQVSRINPSISNIPQNQYEQFAKIDNYEYYQNFNMACNMHSTDCKIAISLLKNFIDNIENY